MASGSVLRLGKVPMYVVAVNIFEKGELMSKICSFCEMCRLSDRAGVNGHVIPEAFFLKIKRDSDQWIKDHPDVTAACGVDPTKESRLKQFEESVFSKRMPVGPYESSAWCRECERTYFQDCDTYANSYLLKPLEEYQKVTVLGNVEGFKREGYDYGLLKKFVVTLLWRATVSKVALYSHVKLPDFVTENLREIIRADLVPPPDIFSGIFFRTDGDPLIISDAKYFRKKGNWFVEFYLGELLLSIKTSSSLYSDQRCAESVLGNDSEYFRVINQQTRREMLLGYGQIARGRLHGNN